jgi:HK97 gp10 family phage protein
MATKATLTLKGLDEYLEKIAAAGKDVDEAAARAVLAGAEVLQEGMRNRVPVRTGNLRENIRIFGPEQDGNFVFCEVGLIDRRGLTDADTARYGNAQEYGTSSMAAQPYIRPTIAEDGKKARDAMKESLEESGVL